MYFVEDDLLQHWDVLHDCKVQKINQGAESCFRSRPVVGEQGNPASVEQVDEGLEGLGSHIR